MESQRLKVLLVEDDEDDYLLTEGLLAEIEGSGFDLEWARTFKAGLEAMRRNEHHVYLLDYRLNGQTGLELLGAARAQGCRGPVILLTGQGDRDIDVQAMKAGAADFLTKGRMDPPLLERSIRYALERHRAEEALRQAHAELECRVVERTAELTHANALLAEAHRRKDEFLAMLGHELRNPLAAISSATQCMDLGLTPAELKEARTIVERQVDNLTRLVDDLLDVARIMRGKISLTKTPVELRSVLARAIETSRPFILARGHRVNVSAPPQPLWLQADATRLAQVFTNLLHNAAKFSPEASPIEVRAEPNEREVVVRIRDYGIGIAADMLPRIFDLFSQVDAALDRTQGGLGIGLTLAQRLVGMHQGGIEVSSGGLGQGSEFAVRLPLMAAPTSDAVKTADPSRRTTLPARRILLVEDNVDSAAMLAQLLRFQGQVVQIAHDGPAALEIAPTFQPEVILLDIGLPGLNGFDVARQLRQQPALDKALLVALTGYGQDEDRRRCAAAGFQYHFVKPVTLKTLETLLTHPEDLRAYALTAEWACPA